MKEDTMVINFNDEETIIYFSNIQLHISKEASIELAYKILDYFERHEEERTSSEKINIDDYVIDTLQKCLNVPPLKFGTNTVESYRELQYITQTASYICCLYNMYKINKYNLKVYKNDKDALNDIKRRMIECSEEIQVKCKELEKFYNKRVEEGWD